MKMKFIREDYGYMLSGHICLIAWSESKHDFYITADGSRTRVIKFDFYRHNGPSLEVVRKPCDDEDHNSVILNSDATFAAFCHELATSQFAQGSSYELSKRNCTHSIKFALKKANINITYDETRTCKHLVNFICCPSASTTPRELIKTLKHWKKQQLGDQKKIIIEAVEIKAIHAEQIANAFTFTSKPCLYTGIGASFVLMLAASSELALPMAVFALALSIGGAGICKTAGGFFKKQVKQRSKEVIQEYRRQILCRKE